MLRKSHSLLLTVIAVTCFGLFGSTLSSEARFVDTASSTGNTLSSGSIAAPSNVTVTSGTPMVLNWTATPTTAADGYKIYRSATSGTLGSLVATVTPRTTVTWTDNAPLAGTNYYVVKAYRQNWVSGYVESPGVAAVIATDNFNGTGAPAATETGSLTWTAYNGTFNKTGSGTATASVAAGASPFLTVPMPSGDADVRTDVTGSRSGEAIYFRVLDNNDWSRLRLRRDDYTYQYYNTEYQHTTYKTEYLYNDMRSVPQWQEAVTEYAYTSDNYYYTNWGSWTRTGEITACRTTYPGYGTGSDYDGYGMATANHSWENDFTCAGGGIKYAAIVQVRGRAKDWGSSSSGWSTSPCSPSDTAYNTTTCGGSRTTASGGTYYAYSSNGGADYQTGGSQMQNFGQYWASGPRDGDDTYAGSSRQVVDTQYWDGNFCSGCPTRQVGPYTGNATNYYLHLEKSVAGTITSLGTWGVGAISGFRVTAVGSTITCFADGAQVAVVTDSTNLTANKHGVGLGGTDTDAAGNAITYAYLKSL